jgi:hypothetical protein
LERKLKIEKIDDTPEYFKAMIYGKGGTRKTTFASTAPDPFWIDMERSTDTLRHIGMGHIEVVRPHSMKDVQDAVKAFLKSTHETLVFDTATRLQIFQLSEQMLEAVRKNSSRDLYLPYQADYRRSGNVMDELFYELQMCDRHVIVIAHEKIFIDDETKRITAILPDLTPRLRDAIGGLINVVAYVELKSGVNKTLEQVMHFNSSGKFFAKNRLNITDSLTNPTFDTIFKEQGNGN